MEESPSQPIQQALSQARLAHSPSPTSPSRLRSRSSSIFLSLRKPDSLPLQSKKNVGICGAVFALVQTAVGSGILALPYAMSSTGIITGSILMLAAMLLNAYTSLLLANLGDFISRDYQTLTTAVLGSRFGLFFTLVLLLDSLMNVVVYLVIVKHLFPEALIGLIGDNALPHIFKSSVFWGSFLTLACFFPLALLREIKSLQYLGLIGFSAILYFVILVFVQFFLIVPPALRSDNLSICAQFNHSSTQILSSIPLFIFGFSFQPNVPAINLDLASRSYPRMARAVLLALSLCLVLYFTFAFFGYLTQAHLPSVAQNILRAPIYKHKTEFHAGFLVYVVMLLMTSTLRFRIAKECMRLLLWKNAELTRCRNFCLTLALVLICLILVLLVPHITVMIQILGSTTHPVVCFIVPILFVLKAQRGTCSFCVISGVIMLVLIVLVSSLSLYSSIVELIC